MLIRAKFEKLQSVRYISHLELMAVFRRAFRRADLPLTYSKGYNPHIMLSLGPPLKVGMIGKAEYFDLQLAGDMEVGEFINLVNLNLPLGINILEAGIVPENIKSLMAVINTAVYEYRMNFTDNSIDQKEMLNEFLSRDKIEVVRQRRGKKDRVLDIIPLLYDGRVIKPGVWSFRVSCGSTGNLRPEELIRALASCFMEANIIPLINIERKGLYIDIEKQFYEPLEDKVIGS